MSSAKGEGRGRARKKRAKIETPDAHEPTSRSMMLTTPLGVLMRIEATMWMNARSGGGHISVDDFYALTQSHGWLGVGQKNNYNGGTGETKITIVAPKIVSRLSNEVYELMSKLTEEERLLFDFVAVSAWEPKEIPNLYSLYRFHSLPKGKIQLEILQQPTVKSNTKVLTRSDVLGNMYHHSRKHFSFNNNLGDSRDWWLHAISVAKMILKHRESMATTACTGNVESKARNTSFTSLVTNHADSVPPKSHQEIQTDEKKMTLEERVRARSLRNTAIVKQASKTGGGSSQESKNKALLELADALRSYSQRRGLVSSGGGGSALDRLRNRGSGSAQAKANATRLTVTDLLKDARTTWNSIVNENSHQHDGSGGNKFRLGGATTVVNIDLSRVLFQLRLKMLSTTDVSDKRQMELQLIGLLEELSSLVPKWMMILRNVPSTLPDQQKVTTSNHSLNIRQSIIIIRNDSVNYAMDVRAKLGGRVHTSNGGGEAGVLNRNKRPLQEMMDKQQSQNKAERGHVGVADVPPSFRRMYGKALGLDKS